MKPELEAELRRRCRKLNIDAGELPRDIIADMLARGLINSPKQAWRTLEKWRDYNYGVCLDLGWLEEPEPVPTELDHLGVVCHGDVWSIFGSEPRTVTRVGEFTTMRDERGVEHSYDLKCVDVAGWKLLKRTPPKVSSATCFKCGCRVDGFVCVCRAGETVRMEPIT